MQNKNKYIGCFTPIPKINNLTGHTIYCLESLHNSLKDYPLSTNEEFTHHIWLPIGNKPFYSIRYFNIIYNLSRFLKVKPMWRKILVIGTKKPVKKGLWVIGEESYVKLFILTLNEIIKITIELERRVRSNYRNNRLKDRDNIIKQTIDNHLDDISTFIYGITELDQKYEIMLEDYIKTMYKLDYKKYPGKPEYYHAISKSFHHKRMLR